MFQAEIVWTRINKKALAQISMALLASYSKPGGLIALKSNRAPWSCVVQHLPPLCFIPTYVSLSFSLLVASPGREIFKQK